MNKNLEDVFTLANQIEAESIELCKLVCDKGWNRKDLAWEMTKALSSIKSCQQKVEEIALSIKYENK